MVAPLKLGDPRGVRLEDIGTPGTERVVRRQVPVVSVLVDTAVYAVY